MQLSVTKDGDAFTVAVAGELDFGDSDTLIDGARLAFGDGGCSALTLDLSGVTFMDCSGLSALMQISSESEQHGGTFQIVSASPCVLRLLALADPDGALPVS